MEDPIRLVRDEDTSDGVWRWKGEGGGGDGGAATLAFKPLVASHVICRCLEHGPPTTGPPHNPFIHHLSSSYAASSHLPPGESPQS